MQLVLQPQDCLYTLVVKHPDGTLEPRVIGSLAGYLFAPDDPEAVIEKMAVPGTWIVSLTITEGGYGLHTATGESGGQDPGVIADLRPSALPVTVFGLVTEALARRRRRGLPPFTVLACDNLEGNGGLARRAFAGFARLSDPELGEWVAREVHFPNSMVDRITPAGTDANRAVLADRFGIEDGWPVVCEPFTQWVLEDNFGDGRPVPAVRGIAGRRRPAARADEAAAAQRWPPGDLLPGLPGRLPLCGRSVPEPAFVRFLLGFMTSEPPPRRRRYRASTWPTTSTP